MVFVAAGLLFVFAAQVVSVSALLFNFTNVTQCAPVLISFTGRNISVTPDRLWLLPINSTASSFPLGDPSVYTTGISLDFVPYAADTTFLTSIDDSTGIHVILTSNVTTVLPSPTGNSSCVSVSNDSIPRHFTLASEANQCEPITIKYDTTVVKQAPGVRLYNPKGTTFRLNLISDDPTTGTATYMMNFSAGKDILLLMDEGNGIQETTPLITVGGNAFNKGCFSTNNNNASATSVDGPNSTSDVDDLDAAAGGDTAVLSKAVIIGSATGGSAVVFIALSMAIFVVQERKKRLLKESQGSESLIEKGANNGNEKPGSPGPGPGLRSVRSAGSFGTGNVGIAIRPPTADAIPNPFARDRDDDAVMNPPYTSNSLFSTLKSSTNVLRGSMASWAQAIPEDQRHPVTRGGSRPGSGGYGSGPGSGSGLGSGAGEARNATSAVGVAVSPPPTGSRLSLESLDIEGMLNMATLQSERQYRSRKNSDATILSRAMPSPSPVVVLNANGNGNEIQNPYQSQYLAQTPNENQTWQANQGSPRSLVNSPNASATSPTQVTTSPTKNVNASATATATLTVNTPTMPSPTFLRPLPTRNRNRRSPLDLPVDPTEPESMAFSGYSVNITAVDDADIDDGNPFNASPLPIPRAHNPNANPNSNTNSKRGPASPSSGSAISGSGSARFLPEPLRTGDSFKIAQATSGGLPVSPSVPESGIPGARDTRRSSTDWYGIAR
ncbi:hypothetical protein D9619_007094 [Psilocybe cf. subviscida]|uniref:Mid2 domain-containing protein n=1 Tax=Psilocybe cf. subviscida TaxID=2480587 RepID=A0A8H5B370_9AGAR|nr:hypothetical protein D9619_007094 [Psilocybe cf. subviscida]